MVWHLDIALHPFLNPVSSVFPFLCLDVLLESRSPSLSQSIFFNLSLFLYQGMLYLSLHFPKSSFFIFSLRIIYYYYLGIAFHPFLNSVPSPFSLSLSLGFTCTWLSTLFLTQIRHLFHSYYLLLLPVYRSSLFS